MATDSRAKGARAETVVRDKLRDLTGLKWERVPSSGALDPKHGLKGDLYVPNEGNLFCVEVKHYADCHFNTSIFTAKEPQLLKWWEQTLREAEQVDKKPLLIFKHDRSPLFVAFRDIPSYNYNLAFLSIDSEEFYVAMLEDWYNNETPEFIK